MTINRLNYFCYFPPLGPSRCCPKLQPILPNIAEMGACVASLCASDWHGIVDVRTAEQAAVVDIPSCFCAQKRV